MKTKSLLAALFLSLLPSLILAQTTITGTIYDAETLHPLAGANIVQDGTTAGTASDEEGRFRLQLQTAGLSRITVSYLGYLPRSIDVTGETSPLRILLEPEPILSETVFVDALRADESSPIAYSNISRSEIEQRNLGKELPFLMSSAPSVLATSEAGGGVGHTSLRIRGVDQTRINVTINGVPLNDAESHGVFWVNMPDFASTVENIQIQRGVGTSTHGAGAFGGTVNIQTTGSNTLPFGEINTGVGSFGTHLYNVRLGSGRIGSGWQLEGRLSRVESDGYIERSFSDLTSWFLSASHHGERSLLKADIISGKQSTYQAWNGVPEPILNNDPDLLENYISNLYDEPMAERLRDNLGNRRFNEYTYPNQTDNYWQDHYHLHYSHSLADHFLLSGTLHYTYGRGYYEQYRDNDRLSTYGIGPIEIGGETIERSDLIRRRWLDNHFYGGIFSAQLRQDRWDLVIGGGYNEYDGDHFGEVIWARFAGDSEYEERYYDNNGFKTDFNVYGKFNFRLSDPLNAYLDLQYRNVVYRFIGLRVDESGGGQEIVDVEQRAGIGFFNPKAGLVWRFSPNHRAFASVSIGGKEPTRRDYVESSPESRPREERVVDYELGYAASWQNASAGVNLYYMDYKDQLILTGAINDVGAYVRENVAKSYRAGIELHGSVRPLPFLTWEANATLSRNRIREYHFYLDDFDEGGQQVQTFRSTEIALSPSLIANSLIHLQRGRWSAGLSSKYVSRQYLDNTATRSRSIDPYLLHDVAVQLDLETVPGFRSVNFTLQVNNILNRRYVDNGYTFGWIAGGAEQHFNYYFPQAGRHLMVKMNVRF